MIRFHSTKEVSKGVPEVVVARRVFGFHSTKEVSKAVKLERRLGLEGVFPFH